MRYAWIRITRQTHDLLTALVARAKLARANHRSGVQIVAAALRDYARAHYPDAVTTTPATPPRTGPETTADAAPAQTSEPNE